MLLITAQIDHCGEHWMVVVYCPASCRTPPALSDCCWMVPGTYEVSDG